MLNCKLLIFRTVISLTLLFSQSVWASDKYLLTYDFGTPLWKLIPEREKSCIVTFLLPDKKETRIRITHGEFLQDVNIKIINYPLYIDDDVDINQSWLPIYFPVVGSNYEIKTDNDLLFLDERCNYKANLTLNDLIVKAWAYKFPDNKELSCIRNINFVREMFEDGPTSDSKKVYPFPNLPEVDRAASACNKILALNLKSNFNCEFPHPIGKTLCDGGYSKKSALDKKVTFLEAVEAELSGDSVVAGAWESELGKSKRVEREEKEKELSKKREEYEKWLTTPDGKKYLIEENAREQKELQRRREQADLIRKQNSAADAFCKPAILNAINTYGKNDYGVVSGRKVVEMIKNITYDQNTTTAMGYGNNFLSVYTVVAHVYEKGNLVKGSQLQLKCIMNSKNQVLGVERY